MKSKNLIMNPRTTISAILLSFGLMLALLPLTATRSFTGKPQTILEKSGNEERYLTPDQVARFIVAEDTTIQIIDLRSSEEYIAMSLPGSLNLPYTQMLTRDPAYIFDKKGIKTILYSNGDLNASYALAIAEGLNFDNVYIMKGGLNEWFKTIINSSFTGEKISARENALFETRTRARRLFNELNSLPDSLKIKYLASKQGEAKKLDGGCE
jgi:rhodanese-related sulfurtransferase